MNTSIVELPGRRTRRRHPAEFKRRIVQACQQGGVSIAAVALANGLNANMVRKWVIDAEVTHQGVEAVGASLAATPTPGFIPIPSALSVSAASISVEIHRGPTVVKVSWPVSAATECAAWLRELVR